MNNSTNTTSIQHITWKSSPDFRGSFNILSTCLSTLGICVWSAVHIDIPEHKTHWTRSLLKKIGWLVVGLLAPELLLFIAFNQRYTANRLITQAERCLRRTVNPKRSWSDRAFIKFAKFEVQLERLLYKKSSDYSTLEDGFLQTIRKENTEESQRNSESDSTQLEGTRCPWTLAHGFYATMGGFVFDHSPEESFLPGRSTRLVITPFGLELMMEHAPDLIPDISEDSIRDRSKAGGFAKFLLAWQMFYFSVNVALRIIQGLAISLLEVSTLAHCLCMLLTCALWWGKPLDIGEPTVIRGEKARKLAAIMYMTSNTRKYFLAGLICIPWISEAEAISFPQSDPPITPNVFRVPVEEGESITGMGPSADTPKTVETVDISPGQYLGDTGFTPRDLEGWRPFSRKHIWGRLLSSVILWLTFELDARPWYTHPRTRGQPVLLYRSDITRWRLASEALKQHSSLDPNITPPNSHPPFVTRHSELQSATDSKAPGLVAVLRATGSAAVLTAVYGIPHFLGWTAAFATKTESIIWRVATLTLTLLGATMGGLFFLIFTIMRFIRPEGGRAPGDREGETLFVVLSALIYISSSVYLVAESFRQLFALPQDAFKLPSWSQYWPHFS